MSLSEKDFQNNVIELATLLKWRVAHFRPAQTKHGWRTPMQGDPGYPDLTLAKNGRVLFLELKSEKGKMTSDQILWQSDLPNAYVFRPDQIDEIQKLLTGSGGT